MSTKVAQTPLPHSPDYLASNIENSGMASVGEGTPVVLADFHHAGLLNSLILLFENRMGGVLYRPIGEEWYTEGFWKVYEHPATVKQFLGINSATPDGSAPLNNQASSLKSYLLPDPIYLCEDIESGRWNKGLTFQNFMHTKVDYLIASIPQHVEPFLKLSQIHPSKPKVIFQVGNNWDVKGVSAKNIMSSAKIDFEGKSEKNYIEYHQEFDVNLFDRDVLQDKKICSFVNMFGVASHLLEDYAVFLDVEKLLPNYTFKAYGGQCRDGTVSGNKGVSSEMLSSLFVWHTKNGGDGYGHVIHNAFCAGRPPIVKLSQYKGKMAGELMIDGQTCLNIEGLDAKHIVAKILHYSQKREYKKLSEGARAIFKEKVDFEAEFLKIKEFLHNAL